MSGNCAGWCVICLTAYQKGSRTWLEQYLERIKPESLRAAEGIGFDHKMNGRTALRLWENFEELMQELTLDVLIEEIDVATGEEARKSFENKAR